jgi:hypothetical protein
VTCAFLAGGALAGFRCATTALSHAIVAAGFALAILMLTDLIRRFLVIHKGLRPSPVF